ncbi:unnamed protein product, partial [Rotaria magnacalcarata]
MNETEEQASCDGDSMGDLTQNGNATKKKKCSISPSWPEAISRGLKETRLQQFLQQMSMSALAETTCSVCNVCTAANKSKKIPVSKIPNAHLLEVSDELKDLIISNQSSTAQNSSGINIHTAEHDQSSSPLNSPYFYCKNRIILYANGLSQQNRFSPANNMWLGDVPTELQGLIIAEEKLISLYRHNSCVIKLHSPFHSTTTVQSALKGNCITFLQNIPNIVNSLPLRLDDLYDVPEFLISTMEERIGDEEIPSERVGYIPDPLADPMESASSDTIPINNSGVLDVNGSTVSSDEITNYVLRKIKHDGRKDETDSENVCLVPHSSKPVDEYFNPKLLAGLYPTLFCYGHGSPEDQSRPVEINLREHIRYLLSYNDRRFERNHSFIFVVFNLLQRRDACFHAQLIATKPYFRATAHEIQSLNSKDIEMALDHISKRTYSSEPNSVLNKLLNHIKTIGGRVMGSAYSHAALRTRIHALIFNQGLPSIFLTLNPADIHSPVALYFAGVNLDPDNIRIEQLMTTYKRAETIASHPVATAKFFHLLITNILDTM